MNSVFSSESLGYMGTITFSSYSIATVYNSTFENIAMLRTGS